MADPFHSQQVVSRIADWIALHTHGSDAARMADYDAARQLLDRLSCDGFVVVDLAKIRSAGQGLAVAVAAAEAARIRIDGTEARGG